MLSETKVKNTYSTNEEEKDFQNKLGFLSNTHQDFISNNYRPDLSYFKNFQGFYNKNFNLTSFRQRQEKFRIKSQSPEKKNYSASNKRKWNSQRYNRKNKIFREYF